MKKKNSSIISLQDYKKQKAKARKKTQKVAGDKYENDSIKEDGNTQNNSQIFYMSNYLKSKKIPDLKEIQNQKPSSIKEKQEKKDNLIILDQYRKEKQEKRVWKKQFQFYTKEALSVSGMAFLFLLMFNLMSHIPSTPGLLNPGQTTIASKKVDSGESLKESLGLGYEGSRKTASQTNKDLLPTYKKWTQKLKKTNKENIIFGKKPLSSDYTGF